VIRNQTPLSNVDIVMNDEKAAHVIRIMERISRLVLVSFAVSLGMLVVFVTLFKFSVIVRGRATYLTSVSLVFSQLFLGATYVGLLTLRDIIAWKQRRYRFSLRMLLIFTTLVAVVLGAVVWTVRK
jgi:hypothetical protein